VQHHVAIPFFVVSADEHPCPYLEGQTACMPLRWPRVRLSGEDFDTLLSEGDRRAGPVLYRTQCPNCAACEALRIPVARFEPTKSHRRVWKLNERDVRVEVGPPLSSPERVALYNRHRDERGLARSEAPISVAEYHLQYVESCVETREIRYVLDGQLVAVSILDVGIRSASSVYHYFDPAFSRRSLGVYSVLKEMELCRSWNMDWYYLGLWVGECASLAYKSGYFPHQRLRGGVWREYAAVDQEPVIVDDDASALAP
jgi:arginine-tRNA-protein transferase